MKMNVGCGRNVMEGWVNVDSAKLPGVEPGVDHVVDLNEKGCLPGYHDSVDEFLLSHVIEHLHDPLACMESLWACAKPNALMTVRCPHGNSDDADEDPTHVRRMFPGSFHYFGQPNYWRADYGYRGDWKVERIVLHLHPQYAETADYFVPRILDTFRNVVTEMVVTMRAIKPRRPPDANLRQWVVPEYHR